MPVRKRTTRALFRPAPLPLRPYLLMCLLCQLGEEWTANAPDLEPAAERAWWRAKRRRLTALLRRIRRRPDLPVALVCNAGDVFAYQEPGRADDSPEGREFNDKRDLDILRALDLAPGTVLPARALINRAQNAVKSVAGLCGYGGATSLAAPASSVSAADAPPNKFGGGTPGACACAADPWRGCPKAAAGFYEGAVQRHIDEILPVRCDATRAAEKRQSLAAMRRADAVTIRPHLLLCAVCQYGGGTRPPFDPDNLPELLQLILRKPRTPIRLARGADWMMCAPCKRRVASLNACVNVWGTGGMSNELRDLNVLQLLGLTFGATLPADELYRLLFARLPTTVAVCTKKNPKPSVWWDCCGDLAEGYCKYVKGREELMALGLGAERTAEQAAGSAQ